MDEPAADEPATTYRRPGPSLMMRFLVVVIGVMMFGLGRGVQQAGGVVGVALGGLIEIVAVAIVAIAAGLVEWWVHRRRRAASDAAPR